MDERSPLEGFLPDKLIDRLIRTGYLIRAGQLLVSTVDSRTYAQQDAVRFLEHRGGKTDPYGYIGRVEEIRSLLKRGFVVSATRIGLGKVIYEVEHGVILHAVFEAEEPRWNRMAS